MPWDGSLQLHTQNFCVKVRSFVMRNFTTQEKSKWITNPSRCFLLFLSFLYCHSWHIFIKIVSFSCFIFIVTLSSSSLAKCSSFLHTLGTWFLLSLCLSHALSFLRWNQKNRWQCWWFMTYSEQTLIRCKQGTVCCWMTMENQAHNAPQPCPLHSGHCRLHLASWFMEAILAPKRDMKGSLEVCVWGWWWWWRSSGFQGQCLHLAKWNFERNLAKRCVLCAYVWI